MATFLRDERLQNLTITAERIAQIDAAFRSRYRSVPELSKEEDNAVFSFYVIRFDNKGYRVFSLARISHSAPTTFADQAW